MAPYNWNLCISVLGSGPFHSQGWRDPVWYSCLLETPLNAQQKDLFFFNSFVTEMLCFSPTDTKNRFQIVAHWLSQSGWAGAMFIDGGQLARGETCLTFARSRWSSSPYFQKAVMISRHRSAGGSSLSLFSPQSTSSSLPKCQPAGPRHTQAHLGPRRRCPQTSPPAPWCSPSAVGPVWRLCSLPARADLPTGVCISGGRVQIFCDIPTLFSKFSFHLEGLAWSLKVLEGAQVSGDHGGNQWEFIPLTNICWDFSMGQVLKIQPARPPKPNTY